MLLRAIDFFCSILTYLCFVLLTLSNVPKVNPLGNSAKTQFDSEERQQKKVGDLTWECLSNQHIGVGVVGTVGDVRNSTVLWNDDRLNLGYSSSTPANLGGIGCLFFHGVEEGRHTKELEERPQVMPEHRLVQQPQDDDQHEHHPF